MTLVDAGSEQTQRGEIMSERKTDVEAGNLLIGWGMTDVTPDGPIFLRGMTPARVSESVHDPITVTALAIETVSDGVNEQAIMLSCDKCAIEDGLVDGCREKLKRDVPDFDPRKLFAGATHSHTAPEITEGHSPDPGKPIVDIREYRDFLIDKMAEAAVQAWKSRRPGGVSWALGHAVVGHNRRNTYRDGTSKMYGNTDDPNFSHVEGYEDHSVDILFTWSDEAQLTGVVVNLSCPSQVTAGWSRISADYWHETRQQLRARLGEGIFILPQCAPAGDQSPTILTYKKSEARMRQLRGLSEREEIARKITDTVEDVFPLAKKDIRMSVDFRHDVRDIGLKRRWITESELEASQRTEDGFQAEYERLLREKPDDYRAVSTAYRNAMRFRFVRERYELQQQQPELPVELHAIRLGDVAFATNPFELFLDFGLRIESRSKAVQTFLIQLTGNGTYLPTERALAGKGYGTALRSTRVGPEGGQQLVEETVKALNALWPDAKAK
ncbi:hypothetical protein ACFL6S_02315 [Candidatus Poribacteria bacterium]